MISVELQDRIYKILCNYHALSQKAWVELVPRFKSHTILKGEKLLLEGELVKGIWLLANGITRSYFVRNKQEVTTWIATEGSPFTNYRSLVMRVPSLETIEAIEDSFVIFLSAEDVQFMYESYTEFNIIGRKIAENYFIDYDYRLISIMYSTAEDKFRDLMNTRPDLFNRVPIKYLASFLDMSPETLSRMRKKITLTS
jgi:CRP-like cAMP-binding protein